MRIGDDSSNSIIRVDFFLWGIKDRVNFSCTLPPTIWLDISRLFVRDGRGITPRHTLIAIFLIISRVTLHTLIAQSRKCSKCVIPNQDGFVLVIFYKVPAYYVTGAPACKPQRASADVPSIICLLRNEGADQAWAWLAHIQNGPGWIWKNWLRVIFLLNHCIYEASIRKGDARQSVRRDLGVRIGNDQHACWEFGLHLLIP